MGGVRRGAGRLRNCTVEGSKRLRVSDVTGSPPRVDGRLVRYSTHWTDGHTGEVTGAAVLDVEVTGDRGTARLRFARPDATGTLHLVGEQIITLEASPQPRGGYRWRFVCPRTGVPCEVLLCPRGASFFAGRKAWRLSYLSQRRSVRDRPMERARAIRLALGGSANLMDPFPPKPRGMWWRTYNRMREKGDIAQAASLAVYAAKLDAWMPGWRSRTR